MRVFVYVALFVPLLLAVFVGGVVFERYRLQSSSLDGTPSVRFPARGQAGPEPQVAKLSEEQKFTAAMAEMEAAWRMAIEGENLFAVRHSPKCYSARFIRRGATVRTDIKKTDKNLFVGIVRIGGMTATTGKFACFKSFSEALATNKLGAEDVERVNAAFSYAISGDGIRLDQATSDPEWFARVLKYNLTDNPPSWNAVAAQPIKQH